MLGSGLRRKQGHEDTMSQREWLAGAVHSAHRLRLASLCRKLAAEFSFPENSEVQIHPQLRTGSLTAGFRGREAWLDLRLLLLGARATRLSASSPVAAPHSADTYQRPHSPTLVCNFTLFPERMFRKHEQSRPCPAPLLPGLAGQAAGSPI